MREKDQTPSNLYNLYNTHLTLLHYLHNILQHTEKVSEEIAAEAVVVVVTVVDAGEVEEGLAVDVEDLEAEAARRLTRKSGFQSPSLVVWSRMVRSPALRRSSSSLCLSRSQKLLITSSVKTSRTRS